MALPQSYRELTSEVATQMRALRKTQPDLMSAFAALAAAGTKEGALGKKTRELVALGIAIASRCDDCIGFHVQTLVKLGTTREEFEDLLATAVYMGGGPSMMYAAHALRAVEEFGGSDGGWPQAAVLIRSRSDIQASVPLRVRHYFEVARAVARIPSILFRALRFSTNWPTASFAIAIPPPPIAPTTLAIGALTPAAAARAGMKNILAPAAIPITLPVPAAQYFGEYLSSMSFIAFFWR